MILAVMVTPVPILELILTMMMVEMMMIVAVIWKNLLEKDSDNDHNARITAT